MYFCSKTNDSCVLRGSHDGLGKDNKSPCICHRKIRMSYVQKSYKSDDGKQAFVLIVPDFGLRFSRLTYLSCDQTPLGVYAARRHGAAGKR